MVVCETSHPPTKMLRAHKPLWSLLALCVVFRPLRSFASFATPMFVLLCLRMLTKVTIGVCARTPMIVDHSEAFKDCTSLTSVDFTGVRSVREYVSHLEFFIFYFHLCTFYNVLL
jgi:hypothetical protein